MIVFKTDIMKRMIFHFPLELGTAQSASQLRPIKMAKAFRNIGYEIELIDGYGQERKKKIKQVKQKIKAGIKYDFLYSESTTMPTLLTEKNHIPVYPFLDYSFFKFCRKHKIPIGLFYRDIYWCFNDYYKSFSRQIAKWFYVYDLRMYNKLLDSVFVPSFEMIDYLPVEFKIPINELPPGLDKHSYMTKKLKDSVNILYVGGIGKHYNLQLIMKVIHDLDNISMTVCCRESDWSQVKEYYQSYINKNIKIVHVEEKTLEMLYAKANAFSIFVEPTEYWKFAVPYKLFEAIGNECPIIATKGTWVGDFVEKEKIGFVCDYDEKSLSDVLKNLTHATLQTMMDNVKKIKKDNTWEMRCERVAKILTCTRIIK